MPFSIFFNSMLEENRYFSDLMKKHFNKYLDVMTKKDDEHFENSTKSWTCDNVYVGKDVIVTDHCHITGKYRYSSHRYCTIKVKLNNKILIVFHRPKEL